LIADISAIMYAHNVAAAGGPPAHVAN
jgi:hypothetical protein